MAAFVVAEARRPASLPGLSAALASAACLRPPSPSEARAGV